MFDDIDFSYDDSVYDAGGATGEWDYTDDSGWFDEQLPNSADSGWFDDEPAVNSSGTVALPTYTFDPGKYVKIGAQIYSVLKTTDAQGKPAYRGAPLTAAQIAAMNAQQSQQSKMLIPLFAAGAALLLL